MAAHLGESVPLVLLVPLGGAVTALVAVIVGLPALRIKGLYLAVSTLAFAVLMEVSVVPTTCWQTPLVHNTFCTGLPDPASTLLTRPTFLGIDVSSDKAFSYICLGLLVLALLAARLWRDHGVARALISVRDNETAAAAMGVRVVRVKALGFALSGFLAGAAGVCFAFLTERLNTSTFSAPQSILVVSMAIIGGLGSVPGAVLGALYLIGLPRSSARRPRSSSSPARWASRSRSSTCPVGSACRCAASATASPRLCARRWFVSNRTQHRRRSWRRP